MKIKRLSIKNNRSGWNIKDLKFDSLTLLVGASGVGKTQILKSISCLSRIATGRSIANIEWSVDFCQDNIEYTWEGKYESVDPTIEDFIEKDSASFEHEVLTANGEEIFKRDRDNMVYLGSQTVRLDISKSGIELLKQEDRISDVHKAFKNILWLHTEYSDIPTIIRGLPSAEMKMTLDDIKNIKNRYPLLRLLLIKQNAPVIYKDILEQFTDVFPLVEDIDFDFEAIGQDKFYPVLKIKEQNVDNWIKYPNVSAGMLRTLYHIITFALAEDGDVILIDEFENGLGINCIDMLADMAMDTERDLQIIMTSHHPYIINSIPVNAWRVVSRNGSDVSVSTSDELRIGINSKHDAFMQLCQTKVFRNGLS